MPGCRKEYIVHKSPNFLQNRTMPLLAFGYGRPILNLDERSGVSCRSPWTNGTLLGKVIWMAFIVVSSSL